MKNLIYIFLITIVFFGCKKNNFIDKELIRTGWVLTDVKDENDEIIYEKMDSTNSDVYLVFTSDHQLIGHEPTSVIFDTNYSIDMNNNISFLIAGSRVGIKYQWQSYFVKFNHTIYKYKIQNDNLFLYFKDNKKFIFKRG